MQKAKTGPWSEKEITALKSPLSNTELAKHLGRSVASVEHRRRGVARPKAQVQMGDTKLTADLKAQDELYWKGQYKAVTTKYAEMLKEKTAVDRLVTLARELNPVPYCPRPVVQPHREGTGAAQSAVLMLSDTHIGAVVEPAQTLTFGDYNFGMFLARLKYLEDSVISIVTSHVTTPVPELVIAMLGDMIDGALSHANEVGQESTLFSQTYAGAHAIAQFLRNIAPHFKTIRVYDVVGNHSRYQNQHKMPAKNRFSNFDKFLYALVKEMVRDIPNIKWWFDAQPFQVFEVRGFTFHASHGDHLKGGDVALGLPNHAVGRMISTTTQLFNKHQMKAPNYYLLGDKHKDTSISHATGKVLINGGFPGVDNYGLASNFAPVDPTQCLFFVHPKFGKTATFDISLKFAKVGNKPPYDIPGEFPVR